MASHEYENFVLKMAWKTKKEIASNNLAQLAIFESNIKIFDLRNKKFWFQK